MILSAYTWTDPVAACGVISASLSLVTSTAGSLSLTYDGTNSRWFVETADSAIVQEHSFSLTISGTDNVAPAVRTLRTTTVGPYVLNVVCPSNVGVSEASPVS